MTESTNKISYSCFNETKEIISVISNNQSGIIQYKNKLHLDLKTDYNLVYVSKIFFILSSNLIGIIMNDNISKLEFQDLKQKCLQAEISLNDPILNVQSNSNEQIIIQCIQMILIYKRKNMVFITKKRIPDELHGKYVISMANISNLIAFPHDSLNKQVTITDFISNPLERINTLQSNYIHTNDNLNCKSIDIIHENPLKIMTFSTDDNLLATCSQSGHLINVQSVKSGKRISSLRRGYTTREIQSMTFSKAESVENKLLMCSTSSGNIHIWKVINNRSKSQQDKFKKYISDLPSQSNLMNFECKQAEGKQMQVSFDSYDDTQLIAICHTGYILRIKCDYSNETFNQYEEIKIDEFNES